MDAIIGLGIVVFVGLVFVVSIPLRFLIARPQKSCPRVTHIDGSETIMDAARWTEYQDRYAEIKRLEQEQARQACAEPAQPMNFDAYLVRKEQGRQTRGDAFANEITGIMESQPVSERQTVKVRKGR